MSLTFKDVKTTWNISLRQICLHAGIQYYRVLNASKKPMPGVVYDPDSINWFAIDSALTKVEKKALNSVDWEAVESKKKTAVVVDYDAYEVGSRWHLRLLGWVTIVYKTNTHLVIMEDDSETPRSWKLETFVMNAPSTTERTK